MSYLLKDGWYHYELMESGLYIGMYRIYLMDATMCYCTQEYITLYLVDVLNKVLGMEKIETTKQQAMSMNNPISTKGRAS